MPFFSLSHYLRLTGIQRKSMCLLSGVGVKNVELLLFLGVPSHTWRTGHLEKRKWKDVLYGIAKRYWRYKAKHKGLIDVKFVTLDTCFRLEITPVCTLHCNLSCSCQICFHFTHFRIEWTCTVHRPRGYLGQLLVLYIRTLLKIVFNELGKFSYSVSHQLVMWETSQLYKPTIRLQPID
jgi:hypothetical protein